jgi:hypothetical protein
VRTGRLYSRRKSAYIAEKKANCKENILYCGRCGLRPDVKRVIRYRESITRCGRAGSVIFQKERKDYMNSSGTNLRMKENTTT